MMNLMILINEFYTIQDFMELKNELKFEKKKIHGMKEKNSSIFNEYRQFKYFKGKNTVQKWLNEEKTEHFRGNSKFFFK